MGIVSSISGHLNPVSGQRIINSHVLLVETELSVNITQFNSPLKFKLQWSNEVCTRCVYLLTFGIFAVCTYLIFRLL